MLRQLAVKVDFQASWTPHPPLFPQNNVDFSIFQTAQTTVPTQSSLHWRAGGIRELTLDANKIEQVPQY